MPPHRWESSEPRRDAYLKFVLQGMSHQEIQSHMGMPRTTYLAWRRRFPDWKAQVDTALQAVKGSILSIDTPSRTSIEDKRLAYFGFASYWHHRRMCDAIRNTPPGGVSLILLPPDHGKSTVVADYSTITIAENPNIRIGYVSESLQLSRKACRRQRGRLEPASARRFQMLHAAHGPFHDLGRSSRPWSADFFVVLKADHDEQDYTFEARAANSQIYGTRLDLLIIDDIQSLNNIDQTAKLVAKIRQDFLSRVKNTGKTIIIGTRVEDGDVYEILIREGVINQVVQLPATNGELVDCPRGEECDCQEIPHEQPLCPEMWPIHELAQRRKQVGEAAWARSFQQRPSDVEGKTFTPAMIEESRDRMSRRVDTRTVIRGWRRFASVDPAVTGGCSVMGFQATPLHMKVVGLTRKFNMGRTENILAEIDAAWLKWGGFTDLIVEVNAFQRALANDERLRQLARTRNFQVHPHQTGINKHDQALGVAQVGTSMADRDISWIYGDDDLVREMSILEQELLAWRPDVPTKKLRQDTVMTLWFGWLFWQRRKGGWGDTDLNKGTISVPPLPWRPGGISAVRSLSIAGRGR